MNLWQKLKNFFWQPTAPVKTEEIDFTATTAPVITPVEEEPIKRKVTAKKKVASKKVS